MATRRKIIQPQSFWSFSLGTFSFFYCAVIRERRSVSPCSRERLRLLLALLTQLFFFLFLFFLRVCSLFLSAKNSSWGMEVFLHLQLCPFVAISRTQFQEDPIKMFKVSLSSLLLAPSSIESVTVVNALSDWNAMNSHYKRQPCCYSCPEDIQVSELTVYSIRLRIPCSYRICSVTKEHNNGGERFPGQLITA